MIKNQINHNNQLAIESFINCLKHVSKLEFGIYLTIGAWNLSFYSL